MILTCSKACYSFRTMALWKTIECPIHELKLELSLACGQSFRWRETSPGQWTSVLGGKVCRLQQNDTQILYQVFESNTLAAPSIDHDKKHQKPLNACDIKKEAVDHVISTGARRNRKRTVPMSNKETKTTKFVKQECKVEPIKNETTECDSFESTLRDYFQLDVNLHSLYKQWSDADSHFHKVASDFKGIRMLRQDPVENLFAFICSSNNHISRISGMVERLCETYGDRLMEVDGQYYYSFPTVESLAQTGVEEKLRELGFGYRAKYISKTAQYIVKNHDSGWLYSLRDMSYEDAHSELVKLCGVGAKVADCVCLMSLDKPGAIPVDTHVWQIAKRDYKLSGTQQNKTLTTTVYKEIGNYFRDLWGPYAGWAHSVLFSADLKKFQDRKTGK